MTDKKYKRKLVEPILKYLPSKHTMVIYGPRQVGKTTLMKYLIENHIKENVFYFDLELIHLLELCNKGIENVLQYLIEHGASQNKKIYLLIDEIQYLDDPTKFIKICHDHYTNIKLLVSGSSTFEIKKKFKESLVGRTVNFELYPLDFEEFLLFKEKNYKLGAENSEATNKELVLLAEEYIKYGGYPAIVLEPSIERKYVFLSQIINTYIRKDIRDIGNIKNISAFNKLVELLASQSAQMINVSELSSALGIKRETVNEYLNLLENTFIIRRISPFHKNLRSELTKNPKVYLLDTGLLHVLWLKEFPKIIHGNVFETFVFIQLIQLNKKIHFWRTTEKQEVDFILNGKGIVAIESKYGFKESSGLKSFEKEYNCKSFIVGMNGSKKAKNHKYMWEALKEI